jgi:hypothetical protein
MEDPKFDIDDESLFQLGLTLPITSLLNLCRTNTRLSMLCRSGRLWQTRLTRDYPRIDYQNDFQGNAMHAYIAAYAADTLLNHKGIVKIGKRRTQVIMLPPVLPTYPIDVNLYDKYLVRRFKNFVFRYLLKSPRSRRPDSDVIRSTDIYSKDLVTVANNIRDLLTTLRFNYTDVKIALDNNTWRDVPGII